MPGRTTPIQTAADLTSAGTKPYRFGFNGKESDFEVKNIGGSQQDYGFRIYDPRLGKFLSVDPLTSKYPMLTPYQFASNRPIDGIDEDGLEFTKPDGSGTGPVTNERAAELGATPDGPTSPPASQKNGEEIYQSLHPNSPIPAPTNPGTISTPTPSLTQQQEMGKQFGSQFVDGMTMMAPEVAFAKVAAIARFAKSTETMFRAMSFAEKAALDASGGLSSMAGRELFVSTAEAYSAPLVGTKKGYDVMVTFTLKKGTLKLMSEIGVKDMSLTVQKSGFGLLPKVEGGWMSKGLNYFKGEKGVLNVGLGSNPSVFNKGIIGFH